MKRLICFYLLLSLTGFKSLIAAEQMLVDSHNNISKTNHKIINSSLDSFFHESKIYTHIEITDSLDNHSIEQLAQLKIRQLQREHSQVVVLIISTADRLIRIDNTSNISHMLNERKKDALISLVSSYLATGQFYDGLKLFSVTLMEIFDYSPQYIPSKYEIYLKSIKEFSKKYYIDHIIFLLLLILAFGFVRRPLNRRYFTSSNTEALGNRSKSLALFSNIHGGQDKKAVAWKKW